jgi:uncharacterized membrane protein YhaH (DUF805 family)
MEQFALIQGRLGRLAYGTQLAVLLAPLYVVHPLAASSQWWYVVLATLLIIVCTGLAALLAVRRLHDVGVSGWYALVLLVPVLNLPGLLLLLLLPSKPGQNRWGVAPLQQVRSTVLRFNPSRFRLVLPRHAKLGRVQARSAS